MSNPLRFYPEVARKGVFSGLSRKTDPLKRLRAIWKVSGYPGKSTCPSDTVPLAVIMSLYRSSKLECLVGRGKPAIYLRRQKLPCRKSSMGIEEPSDTEAPAGSTLERTGEILLPAADLSGRWPVPRRPKNGMLSQESLPGSSSPRCPECRFQRLGAEKRACSSSSSSSPADGFPHLIEVFFVHRAKQLRRSAYQQSFA